MTSSIEILCSSKPLIEEEQIKKGYMVKYNLGFDKLEDYYYERVKHLFKLPYIYSVSGLHTDAFYDYLENHMELGDSIEIFEIPNPEKIEDCLNAVNRFPFSVQINVAELTYQNQYGTFSLHKKNWVDELQHRSLIVPDGITSIRYY